MLAADIGNSAVKIARFRGERIRERATLRTDGLSAEAVREVLRGWPSPPGGEAAVVAGVVPEAVAAVAAALGEAGRRVAVLDPAAHAILPHDLETPETTGADRLLAARAASAMHDPAPRRGVVVVQAGSAVTVDRVDAGGVFRGGVILPGPPLWMAALAGAAQLPALDPADAPWEDGSAAPGAGRSTRAALLNGLAAGLPGAVARAAAVISAESGDRPRTVLAGGWADRLRHALGGDCIAAPDLVLQGIRLVGQDLGLG